MTRVRNHTTPARPESDAAPRCRAIPPQPTSASRTPRLLTVRATADRLQVADKTIPGLIAAGELPTHRIGGCVRVSENDLLVFLSKARQ